MGKSSSYPGYATGSFNVNGRNVASTYKKGNTVYTDYNMSDTEKKIYDSIQDNMYSSLGNLFDITDNQRQEWQNQLNAIQQRGIESINDIYTPIETNLRNNIASRFGNLDNSVFLDKLNAVTNKKAQAYADLGTNLALTQDQLYQQELNNRMNTVSFLQNLNNAINNNMFGFTNAASANSASGNSYNAAAYSANQAAKADLLSNYLGTASSLASSGISPVTGSLAALKLASSFL